MELRNFIAHKFKKNADDAEDIVQDAFHNILRMNNLSEIENPRAYLYQTAQHLAINRVRQQQKRDALLEANGGTEICELSPERIYTGQKNLTELHKKLAKLPEKYRHTFLLNREQDKSYKEISRELNIAESTVEKHIIKALKHLRDSLEQE